MSLEEHRQAPKRPLGFAIITISDTRTGGAASEKPDLGGDFLVQSITAAGHVVALREWSVDEPWPIEDSVHRAVQRDDVDLVLTTGGTGIAPRDVTYPTLVRMFDSQIPGFGELFRQLSFREIGSATLLSRAVGGILNGKVVLALPGSPKALRLAMDEIVLKEAAHLVSQARGVTR
ncbi:MAG TPA: molybdenum cofactor biosynthesis protein B [Planctomycetota bacterium]|nr:molybdenum cofactor biosynthesis protein B [Planctomycetota bacterium]